MLCEREAGGSEGLRGEQERPWRRGIGRHQRRRNSAGCPRFPRVSPPRNGSDAEARRVWRDKGGARVCFVLLPLLLLLLHGVAVCSADGGAEGKQQARNGLYWYCLWWEFFFFIFLFVPSFTLMR